MNDMAQSRRVLIVEDDAASAELELRVLSRAGFAPQIAHSVEEARAMLGAETFAALLLDYRLPDGEAWDLVTTAREQQPDVAIILVTAMGNEAVAAEAVLRGVSEYIRKTDGFLDRLSAAVERATNTARALVELRRNDSLFRTIADHATDAIVLLDRNDSILWASAAAEKVFGDDSQALIGRRLSELLHPEDRTNWRSASAWPEAGRGHFRCRDREGRYLSFEPTFRAIGDGPAARTLGVLRDVTERLQMEERLRHQQRLEAIGQLTGGIAHDFNNLLAVIIANLEILRAELDSSQLPHELAGDALDAALHGAELTAHLLAFARRQPLRPEPCDLNATIDAMVRLLSRTLGEAVSIELTLAPKVWPVLVDRVQLQTALTNLATNARDAMPGGGRLRIETRNVHLDAGYVAAHRDVSPGDYAAIEVRDTGSGISPEILERVFEPFFTTKATGRGTGLGLSMVFGFIKQSGGHISAQSESGSGTVIRLFLPRTATPGIVPSPEVAAVMPTGDGQVVLVVEDNARLSLVTSRQLRDAGYRVLEADSGVAAMVILASDSDIDLLLTDIVMPGSLDGLALARAGRRLRPDMKIVLTSGFYDLRSGSGPTSGPDSVDFPLLQKPYRRAALMRAVRDALDSGPRCAD